MAHAIHCWVLHIHRIQSLSGRAVRCHPIGLWDVKDLRVFCYLSSHNHVEKMGSYGSYLSNTANFHHSRRKSRWNPEIELWLLPDSPENCVSHLCRNQGRGLAHLGTIQLERILSKNDAPLVFIWFSLEKETKKVHPTSPVPVPARYPAKNCRKASVRLSRRSFNGKTENSPVTWWSKTHCFKKEGDKAPSLAKTRETTRKLFNQRTRVPRVAMMTLKRVKDTAGICRNSYGN